MDGSKKGLPRIVVSEGVLLMITKSEGNTNLSILTRTFSTIPKGAFLDISAMSQSIFYFLKTDKMQESVKLPRFNSLGGSWCCKTSGVSLSSPYMKEHSMIFARASMFPDQQYYCFNLFQRMSYRVMVINLSVVSNIQRSYTKLSSIFLVKGRSSSKFSISDLFNLFTFLVEGTILVEVNYTAPRPGKMMSAPSALKFVNIFKLLRCHGRWAIPLGKGLFEEIPSIDSS
ncbi:hypothetical protein Tco_0425973 [Tanacetum coccineum]